MAYATWEVPSCIIYRFCRLALQLLLTLSIPVSYATENPSVALQDPEVKNFAQVLLEEVGQIPLSYDIDVMTDQILKRIQDQIPKLYPRDQTKRINLARGIVELATEKLLSPRSFPKRLEAASFAALLYLKGDTLPQILECQRLFNDTFSLLHTEYSKINKIPTRSIFAKRSMYRILKLMEWMRTHHALNTWREMKTLDRIYHDEPAPVSVYHMGDGIHAAVGSKHNMLNIVNAASPDRVVVSLPLRDHEVALSETDQSLLIYYPLLNQTERISLKTWETQKAISVCIDDLMKEIPKKKRKSK